MRKLLLQVTANKTSVRNEQRRLSQASRDVTNKACKILTKRIQESPGYRVRNLHKPPSIYLYVPPVPHCTRLRDRPSRNVRRSKSAKSTLNGNESKSSSSRVTRMMPSPVPLEHSTSFCQSSSAKLPKATKSLDGNEFRVKLDKSLVRKTPPVLTLKRSRLS
jgi:hypothetical protein